MGNAENVEKVKKPLLKNPLKILLIVFGCLFVGGAVCLALFCYGWRLAFRGHMIDDRNAQLLFCCKGVTTQIIEYYDAKGRDVPADKEYIVKAMLDKNGLVNEPCELLPESVKIRFYTETSKKPMYILIKYKAGGGYEAWMAGKPLTDDMLRPYSKPEQEEMFGMLKGVKDVIGYVYSDKPTEYYH